MAIRIHRIVAVATIAAFVFALAGPASAGSATKPQVSAGTAGRVHQGTTKARASAVPLYDQRDNDSANAVSSQNFEAAFDNFDDQAADDFSVPAGEAWTVDGVEAVGQYFGGPAPSFNVFLYRDLGALPGALVASYPSVVATTDTAGTVSLPISPPMSLTRGTYWISVQANMNFVGAPPTGQWFWELRSVQSGDGSAWQQPGDGGGTGCTTWDTLTNCNPSLPPDLMFAIDGTSTACTISGQGYIAGTPGDDVICGSINRDRISAGDGNDTVFGGTGPDVLQGRVGNDTLVGGPGTDRVTGAAGDDTLNVADNAPGDTALGGAGLDTAMSDAGDYVRF
jgi:Ca2+-binding RTX toxin-like protein